MQTSSLLLLLLLLVSVQLNSGIAERFKVPKAPTSNGTLEHFDPTLPPPLPGQIPKCSVTVLQQDFAETVGEPPASANYTQPAECPFPWTRVVLELSLSASDVQNDRIAAVWIDGAEILRTSTPLPMVPGAFWRVQKDVTRYSALIRRLAGGGMVSMMLENSNATLPGVFTANVTLHFYRGALVDGVKGYTAHPTAKGLYRHPADIILPISQQGCYGAGYWFRINNESDKPASAVAIPRNTYRTVLEIFATPHGSDEFWYTNRLQSAYARFDAPRTNGGFRQIYATIDEKFVGGHIPFAVIYPGAINPYFWSPVAAIGAFDIPSYDLDVTPFLSMLLDGGLHEIGFGVRNANPHWLVTANLHLWLDPPSDVVEAGIGFYHAPPLKISRHAAWRREEGQSEVNAEGLIKFSGWAASSKGNLTTTVRMKIKFKSQVEVKNRGAVRQVEMINKVRSAVGVRRGHQIMGRVQVFVEMPLRIHSHRAVAVGGGVYERTRLHHQLQEVVNLNEEQVVTSSALTDRQEAEGTALVHDGMVMWGSGSTKSTYKYRDAKDCYLRTVGTEAGAVKYDFTRPSCSAVAET